MTRRTVTYEVPTAVLRKFQRLEAENARLQTLLEAQAIKEQVHSEIVAALRDAMAALQMEFNARASDAAAIVRSNGNDNQLP